MPVAWCKWIAGWLAAAFLLLTVWEMLMLSRTKKEFHLWFNLLEAI
jgi:hypothetical protein